MNKENAAKGRLFGFVDFEVTKRNESTTDILILHYPYFLNGEEQRREVTVSVNKDENYIKWIYDNLQTVKNALSIDIKNLDNK